MLTFQLQLIQFFGQKVTVTIIFLCILVISDHTLNATEPTLTRDGPDQYATLVLVAGPHKTSSTSVQKYIWNFRDELMEDGVLLCDDFKGIYSDIKKGANLALDLLNNLVDENAAVLQGCLDRKEFKSVIVAAEAFDALFDEKDQGAGAKFILSAKPKVQVILMLRDFPEWLISYYHEDVNNKLIGSKKERLPFGEWIKTLFIPQKAKIILRKNPYHVSRSYQNVGVPVITVPYLDYDFMFCTALDSKRSCDKLPQHPSPHLNSRTNPLDKLCAEKADVVKLEKLVTTEYSVSSGFNFSVFICP